MPGLDPNDFEDVKPAATGGGLDPSAFEDIREEKPVAPRVNSMGETLTHGPVETFLRSASDVVTLGHHDEISAWIEAALKGHPFDGDAYRAARDRYRGEMKQGNEEHPVAHYAGVGAGTVAATFVPGMNVAKGATLGRTLAQGAALGALAGEGSSEADATKGEWHKLALDTAMGAGVGAVAGAAGKKLGEWVSNAPERADRSLLSDIGQRANKSVRDKMAEDSAEVLKAARKLGGYKVAQNAPELLEKAAPAKAAAGAKIGEIDKAVQGAIGDVRVAKAIEKLADLEKRYTTNGQLGRAKAVQGVADEIIKAFGDSAPVPNFRQYVSSIGDKAYETLSEKASARVNRQIYGALSSTLKEHAAEAAKLAPDIRPLVKELPAASAEFGALSEVVTAAKQRARLTPYKPTGLRSFTLRGLAEAAADNTIGKVTRPMNEGLRKLALAGDPRAAKLMQIMYGAPQRAANQAGAEAGVALRPIVAGDEPEAPDDAVAATP